MKIKKKTGVLRPPPLFLYDRKLFPRLCCQLFFGFMKGNKFDVKATKRHYLYLLKYGTHVNSGSIIVNINVSILQNMKKHRKQLRIEVCSCATKIQFLLSTNDSLATLILTCCILLTYYFLILCHYFLGFPCFKLQRIINIVAFLTFFGNFIPG